MPEAVATAVGVLTSSATAAAAAYAITQTVLINTALGVLQKSLTPNVRSSGGTVDNLPVNVTVRGTAEARRMIFGKRRAGGASVFTGVSSSGGDTNDRLASIIVLAGHQVNSIGDVWLDNVRIDNADINTTTDPGLVEGTGQFAGFVRILKHLGTSAQVVDSLLTTRHAEWTSTHVLSGCAYLYVSFGKGAGSEAAFPNGAPQNITAEVEGALVYDPRLDSTNGGSGSHRRGDPATWAYSANPALHVRHYLTGGSVVNDTHTPIKMFGLKEADSRIDDAYTIAAANICDEVLTGAEATPDGDDIRYACNLEASSDQTRRTILNNILDSMAGTVIKPQDKWQIFAGAYDAAAFSLTQDNLYNDIKVQDTETHSNRFNCVTARFVDAAQQYSEATTVPRTDSAYETQDGSEQLATEFTLNGVTNRWQADRLAEIKLRKSRMMRRIVFPGALDILKCSLNDVILVSHSRYTWSGRVFRITDRQFEFDQDAGRVTLTCQREDSAVYADLLTADYQSGTSATDTFATDSTPSDESMVVADPSFRLATDQTYWWWDTATGITLSRVGGLSGGYMDIACNGTGPRRVYSRGRLFRHTPGTFYRVTVLYKRTSAVGMSSATLGLNVGLATITASPGDVSMVSYDCASAPVRVLRTAADEVGGPDASWQTLSYAFTTEFTGSFGDAYLAAWLEVGDGLTSGNIRIASVDVAAGVGEFGLGTRGHVPAPAAITDEKTLADGGTWEYPVSDIRRIESTIVADGVTDDTTAQDAAFATLSVGGRVVYPQRNLAIVQSTSYGLGIEAQFDNAIFKGVAVSAKTSVLQLKNGHSHFRGLKVVGDQNVNYLACVHWYTNDLNVYFPGRMRIDGLNVQSARIGLVIGAMPTQSFPLPAQGTSNADGTASDAPLSESYIAGFTSYDCIQGVLFRQSNGKVTFVAPDMTGESGASWATPYGHPEEACALTIENGEVTILGGDIEQIQTSAVGASYAAALIRLHDGNLNIIGSVIESVAPIQIDGAGDLRMDKILNWGLNNNSAQFFQVLDTATGMLRIRDSFLARANGYASGYNIVKVVTSFLTSSGGINGKFVCEFDNVEFRDSDFKQGTGGYNPLVYGCRATFINCRLTTFSGGVRATSYRMHNGPNILAGYVDTTFKTVTAYSTTGATTIGGWTTAVNSASDLWGSYTSGLPTIEGVTVNAALRLKPAAGAGYVTFTSAKVPCESQRLYMFKAWLKTGTSGATVIIRANFYDFGGTACATANADFYSLAESNFGSTYQPVIGWVVTPKECQQLELFLYADNAAEAYFVNPEIV